MSADLRHVYWLGGGSGAGKSTVARRLADEHGLRLYDTDAAMADHAARSTPEDSPALQEFMAMDMAERWSDRSPEVMLETFHWYRGEGFGLIVEDLVRLGSERGVIAEGFRLLPELVQPLAGARPRGLAAADAGVPPRGVRGPGLVVDGQPARARPDVHGAPPRGDGAARPPRHRGRDLDGGERSGRAGRASVRAAWLDGGSASGAAALAAAADGAQDEQHDHHADDRADDAAEVELVVVADPEQRR